MRKSILVLFAGAGFILSGCRQEAGIPADSFRLNVREIMSDTDTRVSVLEIRAPRNASISVDGESSHSRVTLPDAPDGTPRAGDVFLSATRIAPTGDKWAYIQTLIRPRARNGYAGGAGVYPVPSNTTLAAFFSISATSGTYKLDSPVTIAQLQDKLVTLVVGKPTK